jgi:hypothetical protein
MKAPITQPCALIYIAKNEFILNRIAALLSFSGYR